ncbi:3-hydroxyacyl-CoA dehydrogenase [Bordetella genomosp. 9]|uniref:3-hydroxyacyl-CoA dehydrogenase n=1 Tax=Bordetella genomosp. 9 TaxID=1416803 RepID=A0A261RLF4_9BORD|nr:SDR family NAD(P)-dependent oxidoreductase [Bordetella genomosp. 9]OZI25849.1 3-hydroxyacyl-CoA dehydrogenase [Bordetella genomosp. 9]
MTQSMSGKVAIVTGAGGGIGRDIALQFAQAGARVVVNDIGASLSGEGSDDGPAAAVVREIRMAGGEAAANTDSIATRTGAQRLVQQAVDTYGRIDCVVNNAGILRDRFFHKMSDEEWDAVLKVHLYGSFYTSSAAAPYFKEQGSGAYVHMTSTSGLVGNRAQANYAAAKMGIVGLSRTIAIDMQRAGVRSNCIAPFAWGRMVASVPVTTEAQALAAERKQLLMTPAKVAPLAVYLASELARDVNGQVFAVRGNEIMLMSQPRPVKSVHMSDGWTPESIADYALPAMRGALTPLEETADVFNWQPI